MQCQPPDIGTPQFPAFQIAGEASTPPHTSSASQPEPEATAPPPGQEDYTSKTPHEWVEALVTQMREAQGLDDARSRAARVLQAFQQALTQVQAKVWTVWHTTVGLPALQVTPKGLPALSAVRCNGLILVPVKQSGYRAAGVQT